MFLPINQVSETNAAAGTCATKFLPNLLVLLMLCGCSRMGDPWALEMAFKKKKGMFVLCKRMKIIIHLNMTKKRKQLMVYAI